MLRYFLLGSVQSYSEEDISISGWKQPEEYRVGQLDMEEVCPGGDLGEL